MSNRSEFRRADGVFVQTMWAAHAQSEDARQRLAPRSSPAAGLPAASKRFTGVHFALAIALCVVIGAVSRSVGCGY
jgi:uncharacterized protein (DUF2062 family)